MTERQTHFMPRIWSCETWLLAVHLIENHMIFSKVLVRCGLTGEKLQCPGCASEWLSLEAHDASSARRARQVMPCLFCEKEIFGSIRREHDWRTRMSL